MENKSEEVNQTLQIQLLNMDGVVNSFKVIKEILDNGVKNGMYENLDSAFVVKKSLDNLELTINMFNLHQKEYINELEKKQSVADDLEQND